MSELSDLADELELVRSDMESCSWNISESVGTIAGSLKEIRDYFEDMKDYSHQLQEKVAEFEKKCAERELVAKIKGQCEDVEGVLTKFDKILDGLGF